MPIDTHWFRDRLADRQLSQRRLARHIGLDAAAVSLMFRGRRRMQLTEAAQIARLLGVTLDEVLSHAGIDGATREAADPPPRGLPLVYWLDGHGELHALPAGERVDLAIAAPDDAIVAQARTAMSPLEHMDRWLLVFRAPVAPGVQPDAVGRYSAYRDERGRLGIGYVRPGYRPGLYAVHGAAGAVDARLDWATPVLGVDTLALPR